MCISPITLRNPNYESSSRGFYRPRYFSVPCGHCPDCARKKQNDYYVRAVFQSASCESGRAMFVTLTYNDEFLPRICPVDVESGEITLTDRSSVAPCDVTNFFKRLRFYLNGENRKISYMGCTEYGGLKGRPHMHFLIFGLDPTNRHDCWLVHRAWSELTRTGNRYADSISKSYGYVYIDPKPAGFGAFKYIAKYMVKPWNVSKNKVLNPRFEEVESGLITKPRTYVSKKFGSSAALSLRSLMKEIAMLDEKALTPFFRDVLSPVTPIDVYRLTDTELFRAMFRIYDRYSFQIEDKQGLLRTYAVPARTGVHFVRYALEHGCTTAQIRLFRLMRNICADIDKTIADCNSYCIFAGETTNLTTYDRTNIKDFFTSHSGVLDKRALDSMYQKLGESEFTRFLEVLATCRKDAEKALLSDHSEAYRPEVTALVLPEEFTLKLPTHEAR